jgi:hypothetical protein
MPRATSSTPASVRRFGHAILAVLISLSLFVTAQAQEHAPADGCGLSRTAHEALSHGEYFVHGVGMAPRNAVRPDNLKWELPIGAATGLLIAEADQPAANRIRSVDFQNLAGRWSNIGLITEIAAGGAIWGAGCLKHNSQVEDAGLTALTAVGAASLADLALKLSFNRQFPDTLGSHGEFWEGGRSFPSGHSAASFAFASVIAHRYPHNRWIKWGAYGFASAVALSRYPAKKHFLSDILVGSTLGYVTGTYMSGER